jgi:hypothetical protein
VKFIFFLTVLINITFFLWEYRKGAPEVYLPQRLEHSQADAQNIILLSNPPEIPEEKINSIDVGQDQPVSQPAQQLITGNQNSVVALISKSQPLFTCYQLNKNATREDFIASTDNSQKYILDFTQQEEPFISNYLVLSLPVSTFEQAQTRKEKLIEQGISDLWLFRKGVFKWRISLGLFSSSETAVRAKEQYARETTVALEVVPSWKTHTVAKLTLQTKEKQIISEFAKTYSHLIAKEVACSPIKQ